MIADPVVYEESLEVDPAIVAEHDTWLEHHVREVLGVEGFEIGRVLRPEGELAPGAWVARVVLYTVRSRADLQRYLDGPATALQQKGLDRFGDRFRAAYRVLDPLQQLATPAGSGETGVASACPNCGSHVSDRFCAHCGQENKATLIAFHRIVSEFLGDVLNLDSRLVNSLWPLLVRPGVLTREYVAGRRARLISPVRMYLFVSLVCFGLAALSVPAELGPADDNRTSGVTLAIAGRLDPSPGGGDRDAGVGDGGGPGVHLTDAESGLLYEITQRAQHNIRRVERDREFRTELIKRGIGNLPLMLFVLLPVYALLLKLLYVRSGRYYVEHLVFSLHLHSFLFLVLGALLAWSLVLSPFGYQPDPPWWLEIPFWVYMALYPFLAMRRVYGQGRLKTAAKYLVVGLVYVVLFLLGATGVALLTLAS